MINLKELDLRDNKITKLIKIYNLHNLHELKISGNSTSSISYKIGKLKKLKVLWIDIKQNIDKCICLLRNLETLYVMCWCNRRHKLGNSLHNENIWNLYMIQ